MVHGGMECPAMSKLSEEADTASKIFLDFMSRIAKLEELVAEGKRLLVGFQQELEVNTCLQGLGDYISKAKALLDELECLADDATSIAEATNGEFRQILGCISGDGLVHHANCFEEEDTKMGCGLTLKVSNHAITMRIIYNMVKLDYEMQETIVRSLDHSTPSEQLESYCLMWDLRPFMDEDVLHQAWKHVP